METLTQWYEENPERLRLEQDLMQKFAPNFKYEIDGDGNVTWFGEVDFAIDHDGVAVKPTCDYNPLFIKILCPSDYPKSFPKVYDVKQILARRNCIHIYPDQKERICYGTRLDDGLDFEKNKRIKDLIPIMGAFLYGQWEAERNGGKWKSDRLHGEVAFIHHEFLNGSIPSYISCPCGENAPYFDCCLKKVEAFIKTCSGHLPRSQVKLGSNKVCPCGSGLKFKRCHKWQKTYEKRKFYLQSLPLKQKEFIEFLEGISKKIENPTP